MRGHDNQGIRRKAKNIDWASSAYVGRRHGQQRRCTYKTAVDNSCDVLFDLAGRDDRDCSHDAVAVEMSPLPWIAVAMTPTPDICPHCGLSLDKPMESPRNQS
jgi:hypothetical protein